MPIERLASLKAVHFAFFSLLTLLLWRASGGEMLFMQRKTVCAESSAP
jgi:hypothetical protein